MSQMTKRTANGLRIAAEQRKAARLAPYREHGNDAPRCPWIYRGFEEQPKMPAHSSGGTQEAGPLDGRLQAREQEICRAFRERRLG